MQVCVIREIEYIERMAKLSSLRWFCNDLDFFHGEGMSFAGAANRDPWSKAQELMVFVPKEKSRWLGMGVCSRVCR